MMAHRRLKQQAKKWTSDLSWRDYAYNKSGNDRIYWEDVEVVGGHTGQRCSMVGKSVKLVGYARHAVFHQPDRRFIFGISVHHSNLYFLPFYLCRRDFEANLSTCSKTPTLYILICGLTHLLVVTPFVVVITDRS